MLGKLFRPARMFHTKVILPKNKITKLTEVLLENGVCQLKEAEVSQETKKSKTSVVEKSSTKSDEELQFPEMFNQEMIKDFNSIFSRYKFVYDNLDHYKHVVQPENLLKSVFFPSKPIQHEVDIRNNEKIIKDVEKKLEKIETDVKEALDNLTENQEKINNNLMIISNLKILPQLKTNIYDDTENIKVLTGISSIINIKKLEPEIKDISVVITSKIDKARNFMAVFASPTNIVKVEKILHEIGFDDINFPYEKKNPAELMKSLHNDNNKLENEIVNIKKNLANIHQKDIKELTILGEELDVVRKRIEALKNFKATQSFSILEAWVPAREFKHFGKIVHNTVKTYYIQIDERCDAPTKYNNPGMFKPFEMITSLYSPPKYKKFDPTILLAFTFTIFFGLMLTDFVYGIIMTILAFMVFRGLGKYNVDARKFSTLLIYFGISTAIWGIVFGSYFGDIIQRTVFADVLASQGKVMLPLQLIDPMTDIMVGLGLAIGIGALHILLGLLVGFKENLFEGEYVKAFMDQGVWMVFMGGAVVLLGSFSTVEFPFMQVGLALIGVSVIMQLVLNLISKGVVLAVLSIFDFSAFFGDVFSYARLIALALGTSGIALGVNFMCLLIWTIVPEKSILVSILLIIPVLIIFTLGHIFNVLMNGLGAFVHTTRLHFLEHFSKYYEGDGKEYKPFDAERKKTVLVK